MFASPLSCLPLDDRGPLRVMFVITSMPVGGAETLLVNLIRRLDRSLFSPELACTKALGPLGEELAAEIPVHANLLASKYDVRVAWRFPQMLRERQIDAVVTVGGGDKMFWGRLAAWRARVPVTLAALHSTGWPDGVGRLNRMLTPITDRFIAVAKEHGRYLIENERFPAHKVCIIPNGIDTDRFRRNPEQGQACRRELQIPADAPVCGIVAALRPEKNHELLLRSAAIVLKKIPNAQFVIIGDGPRREPLEGLAAELGISPSVHWLGTRSDTPALLSMLDVFALTSHTEALPVSILEAMATELPVVATNVGSVHELVENNITGQLVEPGNADSIATQLIDWFQSKETRTQLGQNAREKVLAQGSLTSMVQGYETLIREVYQSKLQK